MSVPSVHAHTAILCTYGTQNFVVAADPVEAVCAEGFALSALFDLHFITNLWLGARVVLCVFINLHSKCMFNLC